MTLFELHQRIQCWLWLYEHIPFPSSEDSFATSFNKRVSRRWESEMFSHIAGLEVPIELMGSPAEKIIQTVIDYAAPGSGANVSEIHDQLMLIIKYLAENHRFL